jgi:photosystem II stability/assembly factor-like uncharacterized protein
MNASKARLWLPLTAVIALTLACSRFPLPLGGTPIPGPVAAGITQTFVAGEGQAVDATPSPGATTAASPSPQANGTATPQAAPDTATHPATAEGGRPRLAPGQPANLVRVNMLDASTGWAVGHPANDPSEYLLRTSDGGQTWVDASPPIGSGTPWAATAFFLDNDHAWATFADPAAPPLAGSAPQVVWRTQDGGQTWTASQPLNLSDAEYAAPSDLLFVDTLRGWLLTHVGAGMNHDYVMLYVTSDGGQTWERIADPLSTSPTNLPMSCTKSGLGFLNPETGWVTGDCHGVAPGLYFHRTTDAGRNWQAQPLPPPPGAANLFSNESLSCGTYSLITLPPQLVSVAVLCQDFNSGDLTAYLYRSADGGQNWDASPLPGRDLFFLDPDRVWSIAEGDVNDPTAPRTLYFSDDGGISWADRATVTWGAQLDFISPELGWGIATAGEERAFVHTSDGGATWAIIEPVVGS